MMVRKIITHAASVVARNKKGRVRVLGRGARSKIKRYSLPASLSGSSTNVPLHVWRGNRGQHKRKVIRTQGYDAHHRKKHYRLLLCNRNVLILTGKELELVEEGKVYYLDIIGVSSTKRRSYGIVELDGGRKLFYLGADPSIFDQAGEGILTSPQL